MISQRIHHHRYFALSVFLFLSLLHLFIVVVNHHNYKTFAFDYGVYNFAFYDFAHFKVSPCTVYLAGFDITFLQDHFSLTLVYLSPLFWILGPVFGTYTLLILQWGFINLGALASYKYILLKTNNRFTSLLALIFYFVLYSRFSAYHSDCNLAIMGSALVPVFLLFYGKKNYVLSTVIFFLLILNREDFALTMFFLCFMLVLLNWNDNEKRKFALLLCAASAVSFMIIFRYIIPLFEDANKSFSLFNYRALGKHPSDALQFIFTHPLQTLRMLFVNHTDLPGNDWIKFKFYLIYFICGGFILFTRPLYLIALIPLIAKKMFNDDSVRWGHEGYQAVEIVTILPVLVFSALSEWRSLRLKAITSLLLVLLTISTSVYLMVQSTSYYYGFNKFNLFSNSFYKSDFDIEAFDTMITLIPDSAVVCASNRVLPHLAFRKKIFYFPQINESTYLCVSKHDSPYPVSQQLFDEKLQSLKSSGEWKIVRESHDALLLRRIGQ